MSESVPHGQRHPRRAYDRDGRMIPPATVAGLARLGTPSIQIFCNACHHEVIVGLEGLPDALPIPDVPVVLRLRCGCGSKNLGVMMDVTAHYQRVRERMSQSSEPPPAGYRVVPWREIVGKERGERLVAAWEAERGAG